MDLLALDSSTDLLTVAVRHGDQVWAADELTGSAASQRILPLVRQLLAEAGVAPGASPRAIVLGAGPGSFTGLRIACGVVQGLALVWGARVVQVSSFEAIAAKARRVHGARASRVWVALDARMGEVYLAGLQADGDQWRLLEAPAALSPAAAIERIRAQGAGFMGCGSGFTVYPELGQACASCLSVIDGGLGVDARVLLLLGSRALAQGLDVDPAMVAPLYVRDKVALTIAERRERSALAAGQGR